MPRTVMLSVPVTGTLDGSGNGVLQAGPTAPGVSWSPVSVSISASGGIPASGSPATCTLYCGNEPVQPYFVDSTYQVTGAASGAVQGKVLWPGMYVFAVFANCNPGASVSMIITGTMTVPG